MIPPPPPPPTLAVSPTVALAPMPPPPPPVVQQEPAAENVADFIFSSIVHAKDRPTRKPRKERNDTVNQEGETTTPGGRTRQPKRSSRIIDDDRLYDGTQLHAAHHGYFVHRDYASHFFRWGFAARAIKPGMRVLDVGCGQDLPLPRVISAPNVYPNSKPESITCCDWNAIPRKFNPAWLTVLDEFDFNKRWPEIIGSFLQDGSFLDMPDKHFDLITCFEVIEHQDPNQGNELLEGIWRCLKPGGKALISTPVFDGLAAANHIHEYQIMELWQKFIDNGFVVIERYGTFASLDSLKKVMTDTDKQMLTELSRWYSNDVLSCFFAPKYPDYSRNNCWIVMRNCDVQSTA